MKLIPLPQNFSTAIEINQYSKSVKHLDLITGEAFIDFLVGKFNKKKWVSILKQPMAVVFNGRKKRDLGTDSLEISIIGDKYIKHVSSYSNSNDKDVIYYQIQP